MSGHLFIPSRTRFAKTADNVSRNNERLPVILEDQAHWPWPLMPKEPASALAKIFPRLPDSPSLLSCKRR
jgi:hypothetical protein